MNNFYKELRKIGNEASGLVKEAAEDDNSGGGGNTQQNNQSQNNQGPYSGGFWDTGWGQFFKAILGFAGGGMRSAGNALPGGQPEKPLHQQMGLGDDKSFTGYYKGNDGSISRVIWSPSEEGYVIDKFNSSGENIERKRGVISDKQRDMILNDIAERRKGEGSEDAREELKNMYTSTGKSWAEERRKQRQTQEERWKNMPDYLQRNNRIYRKDPDYGYTEVYRGEGDRGDQVGEHVIGKNKILDDYSKWDPGQADNVYATVSPSSDPDTASGSLGADKSRVDDVLNRQQRMRDYAAESRGDNQQNNVAGGAWDPVFPELNNYSELDNSLNNMRNRMNI